jgi:hypothetical protein
MDKTLEQILKLLDKADELNTQRFSDKVESSLDEYENDSEDEFDDSDDDDFEDSEEDSDEE